MMSGGEGSFSQGENLFQGDDEIDVLRPDKVQAILHKQGIDISIEEALLILELLNKLSTIIVSQHLRPCK
jgi:hypothetical protein